MATKKLAVPRTLVFCIRCHGLGYLVPENEQAPERVPADIRPDLAATYEDYARHESEQGNHFLAGVWQQAAEIARGFVPCAHRTKVLPLK
jgi:hypothetical protein